MTKPSKKEAMDFFEMFALPRRSIDTMMQDKYYHTYGSQRLIYRKVLPHEKDRGESIPVCMADFKTFAPFGIGIGIYFLQLVVLSVACLISGFILVVALLSYGKSTYGLTQSSTNSEYISISAACADFISVNATINCDYNATECQGDYRPQCELPFNAGAADLTMCMVFLACFLISKVLENVVEEELDEAIQTAKDYSVVCNDPPDDADDPDEWFKFFSNFGTVRYITVARRNYELQELLARFHTTLLRKQELVESGGLTIKLNKQLEKKIKRFEKQLDKAYLLTYPTCRVYATFETEEHQRHCINELEVADYEAIFNVKSSSTRKMFREKEVLDVVEPPEVDSILWGNLELKRNVRNICVTIAYLLTLLVIVGLLFLVAYVSLESSPLLLSLVIGLSDIFLPAIFISIVGLMYPENEGLMQSEVQVRLFLGRLLLSTLFPYLFTSWKHVLDEEFIKGIFLTQVIICFFSPVIAVFDITGLIFRHVFGPCFSGTQGEMNTKYTGSDWSLAEKYTSLAKILFVSMFYTLLNPIAMFVAALAFGVIFLIDRYLVLRKLRQLCMLSGEIAVRFRQQAVLCVALHMIVSLRFIYSWPMDNTWKHTDGSYEIVDKFPPVFMLSMTPQDWMSAGQKSIFRPYKIATILVVSITIYIWIIQPILTALYDLLCAKNDEVGQSQGIRFSSVPFIPVYIPTVKCKEQSYVCAVTKEVKENHIVSLLRPHPGDVNNISYLVPEDKQPHVLAIVKYYGDFNSGSIGDLESSGGANKGLVVHEIMRTEVSVDESKHGNTESMILNALETAPQFSLYGKSVVDNLPKYSTTNENVLHTVVTTTMPIELDSKLQVKTIPNKSKRIRQSRDIESLGYSPLNSPTTFLSTHNPATTTNNNNNNNNNNFATTSSSNNTYSSRRRIHPAPYISSYDSSITNNSNNVVTQQPISTSPVFKRGNRIILKPLRSQNDL